MNNITDLFKQALLSNNIKEINSNQSFAEYIDNLPSDELTKCDRYELLEMYNQESRRLKQ